MCGSLIVVQVEPIPPGGRSKVWVITALEVTGFECYAKNRLENRENFRKKIRTINSCRNIDINENRFLPEIS